MNIPPPMSKMWAEASIASFATGFAPNVAAKTSKIERLGVVSHTIASGSNPRTKTTAVKMPHSKNHLRALGLMVLSMWALTMALSTEFTTSNMINPMMTRTKVSIFNRLYHKQEQSKIDERGGYTPLAPLLEKEGLDDY